MSVNVAQIYSGQEMKDCVFKVIGMLTVMIHNYICKDILSQQPYNLKSICEW